MFVSTKSQLILLDKDEETAAKEASVRKQEDDEDTEEQDSKPEAGEKETSVKKQDDNDKEKEEEKKVVGTTTSIEQNATMIASVESIKTADSKQKKNAEDVDVDRDYNKILKDDSILRAEVDELIRSKKQKQDHT